MSGDIDLDAYPSASDDRVARSVPVIDFADQASIQQIADACREWGFFQVINHDISGVLIQEVWSQTRSFFALPVAEKETVLRSRENPWGYYNNELTKNQRDKKEVFDYTSAGVDPVYGARNRWPEFDLSFRSTLETYRDACTGLSLRILQEMSSGLGLDSTFLNSYFDPEHTGFVRLNYYPVDDPMADREDVGPLGVADRGVHHHSDAGALTVLLQDTVGGLQVFNNDMWYDVPPVEGALVINTGDMMQVWSNDYYQAAIHRVLAMDATDRYSIPFFYNPSANATVSPLPSVVSTERPVRYRPINWSEFRYQRTDGDYADYGSEVQISQYRIERGDR